MNSSHRQTALRLLVALSIAAILVTGVARAAMEPWGELLRQDESPLEQFLDEAVRQIPVNAPVCLESDLFGQAYATRFYPRPIYRIEEIARHPEAWVVSFRESDFDPARASIREPHDRR